MGKADLIKQSIGPKQKRKRRAKSQAQSAEDSPVNHHDRMVTAMAEIGYVYCW